MPTTPRSVEPTATPEPTATARLSPTAATSEPVPVDCAALDAAAGTRLSLWQTALQHGIVYGWSTATWQISDPQYRRLYEREAAILFTEDDLLCGLSRSTAIPEFMVRPPEFGWLRTVTRVGRLRARPRIASPDCLDGCLDRVPRLDPLFR